MASVVVAIPCAGVAFCCRPDACGPVWLFVSGYFPPWLAAVAAGGLTAGDAEDRRGWTGGAARERSTAAVAAGVRIWELIP